MKTTCLIFLSTIAILFAACKKDAQSIALTNSNFSNAQTHGPVQLPKIIKASTTKTQFIANANGSGTAQITYSFASKNTELQIIEFDFLAYESDSNDAFSIIEEPFATQPFLFHPTAKHGSAKASATIQGDGDVDGPGLYLPADGTPVPVTFTIHYNIPSASGKIKSGDTISIQLLGIGYGPEDKYEELSSPLSPQIMLTGSKPFLGLNIYDPDQLHIGLTRIFETEYDSQGGSLGINNLPLVIETTGDVQFKKNLIVKDENNNMIDVTTIKKGKNYTIQFPAGYHLTGANVHDFFVYADVTEITGQASINTSLQPASKFSWTDIAGGRTAPYTIENADYYYNYPNGFVTVTHN
ncbi:MAG: hypothetical protein JO072_01780 [Parafilimonas sp.]|nr:hypothetical protein [Parafilimonas sp.]